MKKLSAALLIAIMTVSTTSLIGGPALANDNYPIHSGSPGTSSGCICGDYDPFIDWYPDFN